MQTSFTVLPPFSGNPALSLSSTLSAAKTEHRLWKVIVASRLCQGLEAVCHVLLILSGIAVVLYSTAMFLSLC